MEAQIDQYNYDWIILPKDPYVMKFTVLDSGYYIVISNLTSIYGENLKETDVKERFHELNPFADMRSDLILHNITHSLLEFLDNKSNHVLHLEDNEFVLTLHFSTRLLNCKFEVRMNLLPADQVMDLIISPMIMGSLLCEHKVKELEKKILSDGNTVSSCNMTATSNVVSSSMTSFSSNSVASLKSGSNPDWKTEKVPSEKVVQSFAKLQNFFKHLVSENADIFHSLRRENVLGDLCDVQKKCGSEKSNIHSAVPFEYEEEEEAKESLEENQNMQKSCDEQPHEPVVKRSKIKSLKF